MSSFDELEQIREQALAELADARTTAALESWEDRYLGRKGEITQRARLVGQLPQEDRPAYGQRVNEIKRLLGQAFEARAEEIKRTELATQLSAEAIDVTLPGRPVIPGHLHLTTQALRELYAIFGKMGFEVYEAPDVELEAYNFDLLNIPEYHPARDMWDTFWVKDTGEESGDRRLLRTHTSPGQMRAMRERCPEPIRVILPGKCYRYEQITVRSEHQFYQLEGLAVGKGITMTDLIGTLTQFARLFYGPDKAVRVRSSYFPFTEPSVELDAACIFCHGAGCAVCKYTGWLELAGAGMVHPVVLANGGYDPDVWSGFAFGPGVERPAMLRYSVEDIRLFYGNDLRFLRRF
ncbi:MAG: phenylalanine--tRNA ligase subunit alpha [Anaerolineae bacterium]|jgi:phenylalanyl-tRNA synthetase alpha chain|nr:phenylalanine--tRNA ligase subunit alpha [Anaerolineae bacterium]